MKEKEEKKERKYNNKMEKIIIKRGRIQRKKMKRRTIIKWKK